ncbi:hypothetical protein DH2020_024148 [Rehmannia glutinosa]|uniref:GST C-terminal domain-containing protein n=1 Tax=Rehmannia glutinosa TaxID=99300 RepID=A0ABR0WC90_REHGL
MVNLSNSALLCSYQFEEFLQNIESSIIEIRQAAMSRSQRSLSSIPTGGALALTALIRLDTYQCLSMVILLLQTLSQSYWQVSSYLEEKYPQHPLLPQDLQKKALNYQAAVLVSANIQPYQNLPVIGYIKEKLGPDEMLAWVHHHIKTGFAEQESIYLIPSDNAALEKLLENHAGKYATGDEAFLADLFLAPQIDGAVRRFNIDMNEFPILAKINESYKEHPAFQGAMPGKQPDAPPEARD